MDDDGKKSEDEAAEPAREVSEEERARPKIALCEAAGVSPRVEIIK